MHHERRYFVGTTDDERRDTTPEVELLSKACDLQSAEALVI